MAKSYQDHVDAGAMSPEDAAKCEVTRRLAKETATQIVFGFPAAPADAAAFGILDAAVFSLFTLYGAKETGEILRHYASVCEERAAKDAAGRKGGDA